MSEIIIEKLDEYWATHEANTSYDVFSNTVFPMEGEDYEEMKQFILEEDFLNEDWSINREVSDILVRNRYDVGFVGNPEGDDPTVHKNFAYFIEKYDKMFFIEVPNPNYII